MSRPTYTTFAEMAKSLGIEPCGEEDFAKGEANRDATPNPTALVVGDRRVYIVPK